MSKLERGVLEIRNGRYVDNGMPADVPDGYFWFEISTDKKVISKVYGPFATTEAAEEAAAATQLSEREVEDILNNGRERSSVPSLTAKSAGR